jgi:murein tripeptide amidase MpaA
LMNPDALVELAIDLLISHANGTDITYGGQVWTPGDVTSVLETMDLWLVPCTNPDGRAYVMTVDDMWRKNRRTNPGTGCRGVDLNRNAEFVWGVTEGQTSCSPCSDVYCGPSAFSEPEGRNVKHLLDTQQIGVFADVHSFSELVLYPWGHAPNQTTDPTKRFTGLPTGTCLPLNKPGYAEYLSPDDLNRFRTAGQQVVDAIAAVRGRIYTNEPSSALYPTTGTQSDYAYARHIADPTLRKVYGWTIETGPALADPRESFHPTDPEPVKRDTKSGLIALLQQSLTLLESEDN